MEYVLMGALALAGPAYAVIQGRRARRPDLSDAENRSIRRTRERALVGQKATTVLAAGLAVLVLLLGHEVPALILGLGALVSFVTESYLRRLLTQ